MKKRWQVEDKILDRCFAIALTQKRFMRSSLKETLFQKGLYADLHQEIAAAAIEAWREGHCPDSDFKDIRNLVSRRVYAFLKSNGICRHWDPETKKQGKGFFSREVCLPVDESANVEFGENAGLLAWCEDYVCQALSREAWQEVKKWANSREPEPQGKAAKAISILKEVFQS